MAETLPDKNLFMMCEGLDRRALRELPIGYHVRTCRRNELEIWKAIHFDDPITAAAYHAYMTAYFDRVYADKGELFFETCLFVCDDADQPIGTAFLWKAYDAFQTVHWFKVLQEYEGRGIGRALLSIVMRDLDAAEYPVYLHTQPDSYRAIKLYTDFGFKLLSDPVVGCRSNDLEASLPLLAQWMAPAYFAQLQIGPAPAAFLETLARFPDEQF